ncbi:hypothetical protein PENTCL1PPCAC_6581 [Pristionchus entomophagus]|uniref:Inner centromere protein ARK-binding domain-containing protein n=1 Tax=Pristionchus entomophagus TaxID=358040 RepID=A0AAV5SME2_9BILA|nr:hypothetical protein PENTCL1PPCAC_6581 [Pristionchus entomophagus]
MPPKRTRAKKSVKEEVDDLPSLSTLRDRRVDPDALFAPILHSAVVEFGELMNENCQWIFECKEELKKICEDYGGAKTVPKTPKRETAFSKIKDTINMFDNLALTQPHQQQRLPTPLVLDNAVEDEVEMPDEVLEEETQNEVTERDIKTDNSPAVRPKTPINAREIKEEVTSDRVEMGEEEEEEKKPRRGRSRKAKTPTVVPQSSRSTREDRDVEMEDDPEDRERPLLPQTRIHTPSRIRMGVASPARVGRSATRENAASRVQALKKTTARLGGNDSQSSSNSSPSKTLNRNGTKTSENEQVKRAELMRKLQEKGKTAEQNREEAIRERAERAKRDREEREMKVRAKKEEDEKEMEKKRMEMKERDRQMMEMKKRQAQSPVRGGEREKERNGTRTPTRMRLGKSPEGRLMKRAMESPLTPRVPVKQHRVHSTKKALPMSLDESEDDEMERDAKKIEIERKRRLEEEAARIRKMKEEEERVARLKEEDRRRDEERKRREREEKEKKEKEKKEREREEKRLKEEEEKKMKTPVLKNKHLANASMNESQITYEMTPDKIYVAATETNYGVDDLDSGDETDDENNPRKKVPKWASHPQLTRTIASIRHKPPFDPDVFFGPIIEPDLNIIFKPSTKYPKRTSSAMWNSPLSNPTKGKSRFLTH